MVKLLTGAGEPEPFDWDAEVERYRKKQAELLRELRFAFDQAGRPLSRFDLSEGVSER